MNSVRQVGLLPAGCQPWFMDVIAISGRRFAYCSTLAIYIYEKCTQRQSFQLHSIASEHKKTITAIAWHSTDRELLASSGQDRCVIVWHVSEQRIVAKVEALTGPPTALTWYSPDNQCLIIGMQKGPLLMWRYLHGNSLSTPKEYSPTFNSEITVCRFSDGSPAKLAVGHADGSLSIILPGHWFHKHVLRPERKEEDEGEGISSLLSVWDLRWDPSSSDYLLCLRHGSRSTGGGICLIDVNTPAIITSYTLPSTAVSTQAIAWIPGAAGMFLTGDKEVGVFRLWNVSKTTPLENIRINKTGFHALSVLAANISSSEKGEGDSRSADSAYANGKSVGNAHGWQAGSRAEGEKWLCPPFVYALCTFMDGGVGLYDLAGRKWVFLREYGHIETIFDCKFKPDDEGGCLLATASFDGTIKVWDVETMTGVCSSVGNEGVIYQISWAPADLDCIAAATARHGAFIWDMQKRSVTARFSEHGAGGCVYAVAWNQRDTGRIATGGADGFAIVRYVDGRLVQKYKHPGAVFSCEWSPSNQDMLLTSCEDGYLRVYYLTTGSDQPLKSFSGHTAKVFLVKWSPTKDGVFCSSSDDKTVKVWDYSHDTSITTLSGHTGPVRGLCWNTEISHILCSGSWDCTVRIWDVRDGACLAVLADHGGDVYGLASSSQHPFVLVSSSRDSTLRLWSLTSLVQHLELSVLAKYPWRSIFADSDTNSGSSAVALLCGRQSRSLRRDVTDIDCTQELALSRFSLFSMYPGGVRNLWDLVEVLQGQPESALSSSYGKGKGVLHHKHVAKRKLSTAQQLEMSRMLRSSTKLSATKNEKLLEAADLYIRLGNIQRYCDIMVDVGQWHKALALAPGVSVKYWRALMKKYTDMLMREDPREAVPFCFASGQQERVIEHFLTLGAHDEAMLVAATEGQDYFGSAAAAFQYDAPDAAVDAANGARTSGAPAGDGILAGHMASSYGSTTVAGGMSTLMTTVAMQAAEQQMKGGSPVVAACHFLAVEDLAGAIACLLKGNELGLAVTVNQCLQAASCATDVADCHASLAASYLALRCQRLGMWELAIDLLRSCSIEYEKEAAKVCIRCNASMLEIQNLHTKAGLPSMQQCGQMAEAAAEQGSVKSVRLLLLSDMPIKGVELGLQFVKEKMLSASFVISDIEEIMDYLTCFQVEKLQKAKHGRTRVELLALSAYKGALLAIRMEYETIVIPLLKCILDLMKRETANCVGLPFGASIIIEEMTVWKAYQKSDISVLSDDQRVILDRLLQRASKAKRSTAVSSAERGLRGPDCVTGSQLPSHWDVHVSIFTRARIKGPIYLLEDGKSAISLNEALMWAKVNAYSPLNSGVHINPF